MFAHIRVLIVALMTADRLWPKPGVVPATAPDKPVKMVVLGDSLSAGLGLSASAAFPVRLQKALNDKGIKVDMINAGVSGDTSSGGRDRLDWSIPEGTEAVILELGANDALRGIDPAVTRAALDRDPDAAEGAQDCRIALRNARPAQLRQQSRRPFQRDLSGAFEILRRAALYRFSSRGSPPTPNSTRPTGSIRPPTASMSS